MIVAKFELPVIDAVRERYATTIIDGVHIANLVQIEADHRGSLDVELPALGEECVAGAVAPQTRAATERGVPQRAAIPFIEQGQRQSRLVDAGPIRVVDQPI